MLQSRKAGFQIFRPLYTVKLGQFNANSNFDLLSVFKNLHSNDPTSNPYIEFTIDSSFQDTNSLISKFGKTQTPIYLSINIQSLMSKIDNLKSFIIELTNNEVLIDAIAIQETWQIYNPSIVSIPGFKFYYKTRAFSRGGGVGFYINENLNSQIIENLTPFHEKIFESITIQITQNTKKLFLQIFIDLPPPRWNLLTFLSANLNHYSKN